jgi:hypothetical protein
MLWLWLLILAAIYIIARKDKFPLRGYLLVVVVSIAMLSPWLVRNVVYFGNPFFPYFNSVFESIGGVYQEYEDDLQSDISAGLSGFSPKANEVGLFGLPREMTFWPSWGSKPGNPRQMRFTERKELGIGPLFIALLPLLVFVRRRWDVLAGLLIVSALCILTWFYGLKVVYIRYWSFFFPLLMAAGGFAFAEVMEFGRELVVRPVRFLFMGIISALVVLYFLNGVMPSPGGGGLPLTDDARRAYLAKNVVGYEFIDGTLNRMDPKPRVYFLYGATARYYCDFFLIAGYTSPHNYNRFWEHAGSGEELVEWLRGIGITHLMVNRQQMATMGKRLPGDKSFGENFKKVKTEGSIDLYELRGARDVSG